MKKYKSYLLRAILIATLYGLAFVLLDTLSPYYAKSWEEYLFQSLFFGLVFAWIFPLGFRTGKPNESKKEENQCPEKNKEREKLDL